MLSTLRTRSRLVLFWAGFGLAALGVSVAVYALYATVSREIEEQARSAVQQSLERARLRIEEQAAAVRQTIASELAGFHVDGLSGALRRWDDANAVVIGTFEWDRDRGYLAGGVEVPIAPSPAEIVGLWEDFDRRWPGGPTAAEAGPVESGAFIARYERTLDNPRFAPAALGYQAENIDMLQYAGRRVDPWFGWGALQDGRHAVWVFWYRPGPDAPVRGCLVDASAVATGLRADLADPELARIALEAVASDKGDMDPAAVVELTSVLPGYRLIGQPGDVFAGKQNRIRLSILAVTILLGVFLIGIIFLVLYSRREMRDAERKTSFVAQVSHELRTPLTSIRMFADMLGAPGLPAEKRAKFAATISRESERLGSLIERLLTFNALEAGKLALAIAPFDVCTTVQETIEEMEATLLEGGMRAEVQLPPGAVFALGDRSALKQSLLNLLDNALKYARAGGIVSIAVLSSADMIRLRVADCGCGIAAELRGRVFDPFVQGGHSLTDKAPGVGLGLSIARGLLRGCGGDLVLLPNQGGAVFEIRLPAAPLS